MLERDAYPAGVPCWVETAQPDPHAAMEFYRGLFGWEFEECVLSAASGRYWFAQLRGRDVAAVSSRIEGAPATPAWTTYVSVGDVEAAVRTVTEAGGDVLTPPFDLDDAGRTAVVADPSGAPFRVWKAHRHPGARLVNEPGTWNWSDLYTRDIAGARDFYAALFGWEAVSMGPGDGEFAMWRLPGYGEFLRQGDPQAHDPGAQTAAPEGFEDAVAWLVQMSSDEFPEDVPSHWSVTFAVDDTDATVERAVGLGATIVMPPFDAPPVRVATLTDPQGAVFSVSKYTPEG